MGATREGARAAVASDRWPRVGFDGLHGELEGRRDHGPSRPRSPLELEGSLIMVFSHVHITYVGT